MPQHIALKDPHREARIYSARTITAVLIVCAAMVLILVRYYSLQITNYETYRTQSERNRVQLQPLPPKRGLIYDRNGILLADNRPSHILSIVRERVPDLEQTLAALQEMVDISEADLENFREKLARRRPYEAVPLRFRLSEQERARLAVDRHRMPGVVVDAPAVAPLSARRTVFPRPGLRGPHQPGRGPVPGRVGLPGHLPCR